MKQTNAALEYYNTDRNIKLENGEYVKTGKVPGHEGTGADKKRTELAFLITGNVAKNGATEGAQKPVTIELTPENGAAPKLTYVINNGVTFVAATGASLKNTD